MLTRESESGPVLPCRGMGFGWRKSPGGSLLVRPDKLEIRSSLWGRYTLSADQVLAFTVVDSHWLTGLIIRIEHIAPDVPAAIFLRFDSRRDEFFRGNCFRGLRSPRASLQRDSPEGSPIQLASLIALHTSQWQPTSTHIRRRRQAYPTWTMRFLPSCATLPDSLRALIARVMLTR